MITYRDKQYVCLLDLAVELFRGKWKAVILCHLNKGEKRFLELQRITAGVSQKVLTEKLRELEEDRLITRVIYPEFPPRIEYSLTDKGKDLAVILDSLEDWGKKYFANIEER